MQTIECGALLPTPIATVTQPIVESTPRGLSLHAIECLTRGPRGSAIEQAVPLFEYIRARGLEAEMDCVCVSHALQTVLRTGDERVSINVHPKTLGDRRDFVRMLIRQCAACALDPERLIIEIGEQAPAVNERAFRRAIGALRHHGVRIAIDDVGHGYANFKSIFDCKPEYLKIDRYFVQQASDDAGRRAVVRSICDLADHFGAAVVAEGVERAEDHEALSAMGITLFQGFLFGAPTSPWARA